MSKSNVPDTDLTILRTKTRDEHKATTLYVDTTMLDALWFFKSLDFIGTVFSSTVPVTFTSKNISVTTQTTDKKKKKITTHLYYKTSDLSKYKLFDEVNDEETVRVVSPHERLSFGVDVATLKDCFGKNVLKPSTTIHLFSKPSNSSLFYKKDEHAGVHSMKTVVGFTDMEIVSPQVGKNSCAAISVEEFAEMCNDIKLRFTTQDISIAIYQSGVRFSVAEYGNSAKNAKYDYGILDKLVETITVDSTFLTNFCGQIDKICYPRSVMRIYLDRNDVSNELLLSFVFKVGHIGRLIYQRVCS